MSAIRRPDVPPGTLLCPRCGNALRDDQSWCVECGLAARTRIHPPPSWRMPVLVTCVVLALLAAGIAVALVALLDTPQTTPPPATVTVPAAATAPATTTPGTTVPTATTPLETAPTTVRTTTAPTATTPVVPTPTTTTPSGGAAPRTVTAPRTITVPNGRGGPEGP